MQIDQTDELGPVDVAVIGYPPGSAMTGDAVPLLLDLVGRGIIRVFDIMFVRKDADGSHWGFDATSLTEDGVGDFVVFEGASSGLLVEDDAAAVAEKLEPGGAAAVIMYENRWAAPFVAAVRRNGGIPLAFERIGAQDLIDALGAAEAASS